MSNVNKKLNYNSGGKESKKGKKIQIWNHLILHWLCINTIQGSNLSDKLKYSAVKDC